MENFNPINFNHNFNIASKPAGLVGTNPDGGNHLQSNNEGNSNALVKNLMLTPTSQFVDYNALIMDKQTVLRYVQNLFKLPETIDKFINELKTNTDPKTLRLALKILKENIIDVKMLNEFLNDSSKDAIQKLLQTMTTVLKSSGSDVEQLKEVLSLLNIIQTNTNINTNSIKELLLLYIPLNITDIKDNYNISNPDEPIDTKEDENSISILFQSVHFSNISAVLNENDNCMFLDLYFNETFPFEKFHRIINLASKEINFNLSIENHLTKSTNQADKQNFNITTNGSISTNALMLVHLIIKTFVLIDNGAT